MTTTITETQELRWHINWHEQSLVVADKEAAEAWMAEHLPTSHVVQERDGCLVAWATEDDLRADGDGDDRRIAYAMPHVAHADTVCSPYFVSGCPYCIPHVCRTCGTLDCEGSGLHGGLCARRAR